MEKNSLLKIAFVSGGNVANAGLAFIFMAVIAKALPLEEFGRYALITSLLLVFAKLVDFGSNHIYVTKTLTDENPKTITESFHTFKIILFLVVTPISLFTVNKFFPNDINLFLLFLIGLAAYTLNFTLYAHFQRSEKFTHLILLNTIPSIVKVILAFLILFNIVPANLTVAFAVFTFSILTDVIMIPFLPKDYRHFSFNTKHIKMLITKGYPSGVSQLVQESWPAVNNAIARFVRGFADVGIFSLASKISNIFSLLSLSIFTVLLPKNAKLRGKKIKYDLTETVFIALMILGLALFAIVGAEIGISSIFGDKFSGSIKVLDLLIFAAAISAIHTFTENYFLVEEKNSYIFWVNIVKIISFVIPAYFLSNTYGIVGLAVSNLIAAVTALLTTIIFISRNRSKLLTV